MPKCKPDRKGNVDIQEKWTLTTTIINVHQDIVIQIHVMFVLSPVVVFLFLSVPDIPQSLVILPILILYPQPGKDLFQVSPHTMVWKESLERLEVVAIPLRQLPEQDNPRSSLQQPVIQPEQELPLHHQYLLHMEIQEEK